MEARDTRVVLKPEGLAQEFKPCLYLTEEWGPYLLFLAGQIISDETGSYRPASSPESFRQPRGIGSPAQSLASTEHPEGSTPVAPPLPRCRRALTHVWVLGQFLIGSIGLGNVVFLSKLLRRLRSRAATATT